MGHVAQHLHAALLGPPDLGLYTLQQSGQCQLHSYIVKYESVIMRSHQSRQNEVQMMSLFDGFPMMLS